MAGTGRRTASGSRAAQGHKGQATKEVIKQAILRQVNERGFTNFRLKDVCQQTGLTIGAFYFHFASKEQALEEVAAQAAIELFSTICSDIESKPLEEEFRAVITDYQRGYIDPKLREQTLMMRSLIPANAMVTETYFGVRKTLIDKLVANAARERRRAGLNTGMERAVIEYLFCGLADFMEQLYFGNDATLRRSAGGQRSVVERLARLWYQAVMQA